MDVADIVLDTRYSRRRNARLAGEWGPRAGPKQPDADFTELAKPLGQMRRYRR
jgi:hypothetical protein